MKKLIIFIIICALAIGLCSCIGGSNEDTYPQLCIASTIWRADNIYLPLRANHQFAINHLYDEVETDQGYDIIVHVRRITND